MNVTNETRPDPEALLAALRKAETRRKRGARKGFLGMTAGMGKTFAMLTAVQKQRADGRDVAIGYVETHGRKETDALTEGLPLIPRKPIVYRDVKLTATEYSLLRLFVQHAGKVLTHRQILREVWGSNDVEQTHYLRVCLAHLREKLEINPSRPELFLTESGVGHRLMERESSSED